MSPPCLNRMHRGYNLNYFMIQYILYLLFYVKNNLCVGRFQSHLNEIYFSCRNNLHKLIILKGTSHEDLYVRPDGVPAAEDAAGARAGHADGVPEQEQDAGGGAAEPRAPRARGARGGAAGLARTEGE